MNRMDRLSYNIQYTKEQVKYMKIELTYYVTLFIALQGKENQKYILLILINKSCLSYYMWSCCFENELHN